ncbi:hypothetical protein J3Q64DRAFT_1700941 [Phycomyces blakesleeanus]
MESTRERSSIGRKTINTAKPATITNDRLSSEQLISLSRRIDPSELLPPNCPPTKPDLPPFLYQTCSDLWSRQPLPTHPNIHLLADLFKIRFTQAKCRLSNLLKDIPDHPLSHSLQTPSMHCIQPLFKHHMPGTLKRTVGNGKNLFHLGGRKNILPSPSLPTIRRRNTKGHKKKAPVLQAKTKRTPGTRRQPQAQLIPPITLEDGSVVFVCEPCNKRYKNRGGLIYHLDRCQYQLDKKEEDPVIMHCVCDKPSEDSRERIQCDDCREWLHLDCITKPTTSEFHCPRCVTSYELPQPVDGLIWNPDLSDPHGQVIAAWRDPHHTLTTEAANEAWNRLSEDTYRTNERHTFSHLSAPDNNSLTRQFSFVDTLSGTGLDDVDYDDTDYMSVQQLNNQLPSSALSCEDDNLWFEFTSFDDDHLSPIH